MVVTEITTKADFDEKIASSQLVVVDFHATWCGPCKMIAPKIVKMSETYTDVVFLKVDVDEVDEVAQEQSISAMPTFFFFKNGKKVAEVVGANADKIEELIKQHK